MKVPTALCLALLTAFTVAARAEEDGRYLNGESVTLKADTAYFLFREVVPKDTQAVGIAFVRLLDPGTLNDDLAKLHKDPDAEITPNVFYSMQHKTYAVDGEVQTYLIAVPAGDYVIAGSVFWVMHGTCMCMGTVGFDAKSGVITDLGYVLSARDDKPTIIPELTKYVLGKDIDMQPKPVVPTVKPFAEGMMVPAALAGLARVSAQYRAVGKFPNYFGGPIGRMAPVPGVLDYDANGEVVDLKAVTDKATK